MTHMIYMYIYTDYIVYGKCYVVWSILYMVCGRWYIVHGTRIRSL